MPDFDPKKPVQTRDGRPARIICTDRDHIDGPIVALIKNNIPNHPHEGEEIVVSYHANGMYHSLAGDLSSDLINIPEKRSQWQTVTLNNGWLFDRFPTKNLAIAAQTQAMIVIGHLRFDYEDDVLINVEFEPVS